MRDNDPMPFGKYKGEKMIDVPAEYLLWLLENDKCSNNVREYIIDVKDVLLEEIKHKKK